MGYKSILVNVDIDGPVTPLIKLAGDLAHRHGARLIGCAGADIVPPLTTVDGMVVNGEILERQRADIEARLEELNTQFMQVLSGQNLAVEWRGDVTTPSRLAIGLAHLADLIVTASPEGAGASNAYRSIDLGELLLQAGRPVLIAAANAEQVLARKVLIAWKDTREARRAVACAIPLLGDAHEVVVATVAPGSAGPEKQNLEDVSAYLQCHGIKARPELLVEKHEAAALIDFATSMNADLIVSGGFGHSRLRELIFGGVTRSFLNETGFNRLMSA